MTLSEAWSPPAYLQDATGTIVGRASQNAVIELDPTTCRFGSGQLRCPPLGLQPLLESKASVLTFWGLWRYGRAVTPSGTAPTGSSVSALSLRVPALIPRNNASPTASTSTMPRIPQC